MAAWLKAVTPKAQLESDAIWALKHANEGRNHQTGPK